MSWLSDLAGKAEGLLNQLDQTTASALQKSPSQSSGVGSSTKPVYHYAHESGGHEKGIGQYSSTTYDHPHRSASHVAFETSPKRDHRSSGYASSVSSVPGIRTQEKDKEDKLIDYLNEPRVCGLDSQEDDSSTVDQPARTVPLSRRSSASSLRSLPTQLARTVVTKPVDNSPAILQEQWESNEAAVEVDRPVASYSQITTSLTSSALERDLREHIAMEADLRKALQAKDSQVAVLRVRLQEAEQLVEQKTFTLQRLEAEHQRLLKDSVDSSSYRNQALETIQQQLRDSQALVDRERFENKQTETNNLSRIQKLEREQGEVLQQLTAAQKSLTEEKLKCKQAAEQLKLAKYNLEANKQEFDEYKQKAQRVLQTKEKLLETLKENSVGPANEQAGLVVELEELRTERDMIKDDLQQAQLQLYNLKAEFQELESQLAAEQRRSLEQQYQSQEQCQQYQLSAVQYREQFEQLKREHQYMQDESRRQSFALQTKLHEKDTEVTRLMNQLTARVSMAGGEVSESENRIRQLTESLIQKQTVIEGLQTDKKSLTLQLERMERLYREAEAAAIRASTTSIHMGSSDEGLHSRVPSFLRETPQDTGVARSVKRAYTTVDSLSVKVGVFLRRYPAARFCVFCYIVLLHAWVMVVLLTYTPEAHPQDYHQPKPLP